MTPLFRATLDKATAERDPRVPLFEAGTWTFETMQNVYEAVEEVALNELGLDVYPNQIEIISAEQMLDAYCSIGMPLMYAHWSFGKRFVRDETLYRKGYQALAYEIVINSNPCISYYMEENTMAMQTLVLAHAAYGHNHFYKNNYLFQQWTDPAGILDYLDFAKHYVAECEERYGCGEHAYGDCGGASVGSEHGEFDDCQRAHSRGRICGHAEHDGLAGEAFWFVHRGDGELV